MWILEYRGFDILKHDSPVIVCFRTEKKAKQALSVVGNKLKEKFPKLDWMETPHNITCMTNGYIYGKVYKTKYWEGNYTDMPYLKGIE